MKKSLLLTTALVAATFANNAMAETEATTTEATKQIIVTGSETQISQGTIFKDLKGNVGSAIYVQDGATLNDLDNVEFSDRKSVV